MARVAAVARAMVTAEWWGGGGRGDAELGFVICFTGWGIWRRLGPLPTVPSSRRHDRRHPSSSSRSSERQGASELRV